MLGSCWNHRALNLRALASEHGNGFTLLVGHTHVVNAMTSAERLLHALASEHVAQPPGLEKLDGAARRHRVLVVAVAGKGESGIGEREDETAVADLVPVEVQRLHRHAHHRAPGFAGQQRHAHGVLARGVDRKHRLAHSGGAFLW